MCCWAAVDPGGRDLGVNMIDIGARISQDDDARRSQSVAGVIDREDEPARRIEAQISGVRELRAKERTAVGVGAALQAWAQLELGRQRIRRADRAWLRHGRAILQATVRAGQLCAGVRVAHEGHEGNGTSHIFEQRCLGRRASVGELLSGCDARVYGLGSVSRGGVQADRAERCGRRDCRQAKRPGDFLQPSE